MRDGDRHSHEFSAAWHSSKLGFLLLLPHIRLLHCGGGQAPPERGGGRRRLLYVAWTGESFLSAPNLSCSWSDFLPGHFPLRGEHSCRALAPMLGLILQMAGIASISCGCDTVGVSPGDELVGEYRLADFDGGVRVDHQPDEVYQRFPAGDG